MSHDVSALTRRTLSHLLDLHDATMTSRPPFSSESAPTAAIIAIEAANAWHSFFRAYFLFSASSGWLADGVRVQGGRSVRSVSRALDEAIFFVNGSLIKPQSGWKHKHEPDWRDPAIVSRLMAHFGLSTAAAFNHAMSVGSGSHQHLFTCRNFVAHRNRGTALKLRELATQRGVRGDGSPLELAFMPGRGRPQALMADWLDEFIAIVELLPA